MSITKWKAGGFGKNLIEPFVIVRETEKSVFYYFECFGKKSERRADKVSEFTSFHNTWEEAKEFLQKKADREVDLLRRKLEEAKGRSGNIRGLKKPDDSIAMEKP